jgi:hypothetical protein
LRRNSASDFGGYDGDVLEEEVSARFRIAIIVAFAASESKPKLSIVV